MERDEGTREQVRRAHFLYVATRSMQNTRGYADTLRYRVWGTVYMVEHADGIPIMGKSSFCLREKV